MTRYAHEYRDSFPAKIRAAETGGRQNFRPGRAGLHETVRKTTVSLRT